MVGTSVFGCYLICLPPVITFGFFGSIALVFLISFGSFLAAGVERATGYLVLVGAFGLVIFLGYFVFTYFLSVAGYFVSLSPVFNPVLDFYAVRCFSAVLGTIGF